MVRHFTFVISHASFRVAAGRRPRTAKISENT